MEDPKPEVKKNSLEDIKKNEDNLTKKAKEAKDRQQDENSKAFQDEKVGTKVAVPESSKFRDIYGKIIKVGDVVNVPCKVLTIEHNDGVVLLQVQLVNPPVGSEVSILNDVRSEDVFKIEDPEILRTPNPNSPPAKV